MEKIEIEKRCTYDMISSGWMPGYELITRDGIIDFQLFEEEWKKELYRRTIDTLNYMLSGLEDVDNYKFVYPDKSADKPYDANKQAEMVNFLNELAEPDEQVHHHLR